MDRTAVFIALVSEQPEKRQEQDVSRQRKEANPFLSATVRLSDEVASLDNQVKLFRLDHSRASLSSVSRSGAAISSGAEKLQTKFSELERSVKALDQAVKLNRGAGLTSQGRQHLERVVVTLEQRLSFSAKNFQQSLQKRAKSLADRQERQKSLFGEYNYGSVTSTTAAQYSLHSDPLSKSGPQISKTAGNQLMDSSRQGNRQPFQNQAALSSGTFVSPSTFGGTQITSNGLRESNSSNPPREAPFYQFPNASDRANGNALGQLYGNGSHGNARNGGASGNGYGAQSVLDENGPQFIAGGTMRHRPGTINNPSPLLFNHQEEGGDQPNQQQQVFVRRREKLEVQRSRLNDVTKVERTIGDLSQMFVRVAGLVKEHEETINDIESMVDDTQANTNVAQMELMKLFRFVSGDRGLIVKLLIATLLIGMIIIYFWT